MSFAIPPNSLEEYTSRMFLRMVGSALGQGTELDDASGFLALVSFISVFLF